MYVTRHIIGPQVETATHLGFNHTMSGVSNFKPRLFVIASIIQERRNEALT